MGWVATHQKKGEFGASDRWSKDQIFVGFQKCVKPQSVIRLFRRHAFVFCYTASLPAIKNVSPPWVAAMGCRRWGAAELV